MTTDAFGRTPIADFVKQSIAEAFTAVPDGKRGVLLVHADLESNAVAHSQRSSETRGKSAGGVGFQLGEKRPFGYVAVEGSW